MNYYELATNGFMNWLSDREWGGSGWAVNGGLSLQKYAVESRQMERYIRDTYKIHTRYTQELQEKLVKKLIF